MEIVKNKNVNALRYLNKWPEASRTKAHFDVRSKVDNITNNNYNEESRFQVEGPSGNVDVDIAARTCTCRFWQLTGMPCHHAVAAIAFMNQRPGDHCDAWLTVGSYNATYHWCGFIGNNTLGCKNQGVPQMPRWMKNQKKTPTSESIPTVDSTPTEIGLSQSSQPELSQTEVSQFSSDMPPPPQPTFVPPPPPPQSTFVPHTQSRYRPPPIRPPIRPAELRPPTSAGVMQPEAMLFIPTPTLRGIAPVKK
ncbi:hypothetical protein RIF29_19989 [Crotalaria pallida]|uniref:SWIM-type domain-containing protein n=1 Tax=Crotalaria pallida TaxID=3830 RepID=A0AAN9F2M9_CROPI